MGLGSSQVRFLALTDRDHDISRMLQTCANQKEALARDMQHVTRDYHNALCAKSLKWSNNAGITYSDISYSTLMRPNAANAKSPMMVTDLNGRIVLDSKYAKYAEMLDAAGGKWEGSIKNKILSELTGIPEGTIEAQDKAVADAGTAADKFEKLREDYDRWASKKKKKSVGKTQFLSIDNLAKKLGTVNGVDISKIYSKGEHGEYSIKSKSDIQSLANGIKNNMSKYFVDDETYLGVTDKSAFEKACNDFVSYYQLVLESSEKNADEQRKAAGITGSTNDWKLDISQAFKFIMEAYKANSGSTFEKDTSGNITFPLRDTGSSEWKSWYEELKSKKDAMDAAKNDYNSAADVANQVMTADQEASIQYYNLLFQSIADNGWVLDNQVSDSDYLSQMLQNNSYTLTTITENSCYNENEEPSTRNCQFYYDTSLASDCDNIFMVNDSEARDKALVEYEYKKSLISNKESKIDIRMKNLETEQASIKKMMESITKVKEDNIERTMEIFS